MAEPLRRRIKLSLARMLSQWGNSFLQDTTFRITRDIVDAVRFTEALGVDAENGAAVPDHDDDPLHVPVDDVCNAIVAILKGALAEIMADRGMVTTAQLLNRGAENMRKTTAAAAAFMAASSVPRKRPSPGGRTRRKPSKDDDSHDDDDGNDDGDSEDGKGILQAISSKSQAQVVTALTSALALAQFAIQRARTLWLIGVVAGYAYSYVYFSQINSFVAFYYNGRPLWRKYMPVIFSAFGGVVTISLLKRVDHRIQLILRKAKITVESLSLLVTRTGEGSQLLPLLTLSVVGNIEAWKQLREVTLKAIQAALRRVEAILAVLVGIGVFSSVYTLVAVFLLGSGLDDLDVILTVLYIALVLPTIYTNLDLVVQINLALSSHIRAISSELQSIPTAIAYAQAEIAATDREGAAPPVVRARAAGGGASIHTETPAQRIQRLETASRVLQAILDAERAGLSTITSDTRITLFGIAVTPTLVKTVFGYLVSVMSAILYTAASQTQAGWLSSSASDAATSDA